MRAKPCCQNNVTHWGLQTSSVPKGCPQLCNEVSREMDGKHLETWIIIWQSEFICVDANKNKHFGFYFKPLFYLFHFPRNLFLLYFYKIMVYD